MIRNLHLCCPPWWRDSVAFVRLCRSHVLVSCHSHIILHTCPKPDGFSIPESLLRGASPSLDGIVHLLPVPLLSLALLQEDLVLGIQQAL